MTTLRTSMRLASPSALKEAALTDLERIVGSMSEVDAWFDADERRLRGSGIVLADRMNDLSGKVTAGEVVSIGNQAAIRFADAGRIALNYRIPQSYFMAIALAFPDTSAFANTNALIASANSSGNRFFLGTSSQTVRLDHGTGAGQSLIMTSPTLTPGAHVIWVDFNADTGAAAIGMDAVTSQVTGVITTPHKGWLSTDIAGSTASSGWGLKGDFFGLIACNRSLGDEANEERRAVILEHLHAQANVQMGA